MIFKFLFPTIAKLIENLRVFTIDSYTYYDREINELENTINSIIDDQDSLIESFYHRLKQLEKISGYVYDYQKETYVKAKPAKTTTKKK